MDLSHFLSTWNGVKLENRMSRIVIMCLAMCLVIMTFIAATRNQIVIIRPPTITEEVWVASDTASDDLHKKWGLFMALLMGNVNPENVDFIKHAIGEQVDSSIYHNVIDGLNKQIKDIKQDSVSISFQPKSILYEKQSGKTFVSGLSRVSGKGGTAETVQRTYEFEYRIVDYNPTLVSLDNYRGIPHTIPWHQNEAQKSNNKGDKREG